MAELRVKSTGTLKLFENDNTSSVTIASPASLGADRTVTLPDASVTLASGTMLATDGDGSSLTGLTPGITMTDSWRITAQVNVATDADITTNWERDDTSGAGFIGTGLTESSGIFTFPQTGIYQIFYTMNFGSTGTDSAFFLHLKTSIDGTNYTSRSIICNGYIAGDQMTSSMDTIFDVTNTTNCKFKFYTDNFTTGTSVWGRTDYTRSGFNVIRLGDT
jgi:hypothetical protein